MASKSSKSDSRVRVEKYPLPSTVESIMTLIREIMEKGSVQRIELDVSLPVRVVRSAEAGDPLLEEFDLGLKGVLRQVEFIEYYSEGASSFQVVVDMLHILHKENLHASCWATGPNETQLLDRWLEWKERGLPSGTEQLLGLPVRIVDDLPEDSLILCGSDYPSAETNEISVAIKTAIEIRSEDARPEPVRETDDPVRPRAERGAPAAGQLALAAGGLRTVAWESPDQHGEGVE